MIIYFIWNQGMSSEKAKEEYVKFVKKLAEKHGFKEMAERLWELYKKNIHKIID